MKHKLYVVAVPIGNLEEMSGLGNRILRDVKTIFCEDTRVTRKLLNLLDIWRGQELIKLNQFNESECSDLVMERLGKGDCALVSDAGYPVISDPGYLLIKRLRGENFPVQVVNGPCAFIHAVVGSGIDSRRIFFASFLTKKKFQRKRELERLRLVLEEATVVYYESKNFMVQGLEILMEVFGDIRIGVMRELSKLNESWYFDSISRIREQISFKGEFVVIIPRMDREEASEQEMDVLVEEVRRRVSENGIPLRSACNLVGVGLADAKVLYKKYIGKYKK